MKRAVETDTPSEDLRVCTETRAPNRLADHDDGLFAGCFVLLDEKPPDQRCDAREPKPRCRHLGDGYELGCTLGWRGRQPALSYGQLTADGSKRTHRLDGLERVAPALVVCELGTDRLSRYRIEALDGDDPITFDEGHRASGEHLEEAREAGRDGDDDRYRETADQSHAPRLPQHAHAEHDVEREPAEPREAALIAQPVQDVGRSACSQPSETRGLAWRMTFATKVMLDHLEMEL